MNDPIPPIDEELKALFEAVVNRDLTPAGQERLAERLDADSEARAAYIQAMAFESMLSHEFPVAESHVASSALEVPEFELPQQSQPSSPSRVNAKSPLFVFAMASVAATVLLLISLAPRVFGPSPIATLVSSEDAAWESELPTTPGSTLVPGKMFLKSGVATIRFDSGAELVLGAPTQLELINTMRAKISAGAAVVEVPEPAIGFVIETPDGYAVDYGTRFAVRVDAHENISDFELLEGEIAVHHPPSGDEMRLTSQGKTVTVSSQSLRIVDSEIEDSDEERWPKVIRIGTNGRAASVRRDDKRPLNPAVLSVRRTKFGNADMHSFFEFDLSTIDLQQVRSARLLLNLVPVKWGYARLPKNSEFGIYGLTNPMKADWKRRISWKRSPKEKDGVLLGTFEVPRSRQRGSFEIQNDDLLKFLQAHQDGPVTLILVRENVVDDVGIGLKHAFATDAHPESAGPTLEFTSKD